MQLFWMEMKKIFSWKIVALIVFVNVLLYWALFEFHIENFPNGRPAGDDFKIEQQIIPKYGADIDEEEYKDIVATYEQEVEKANTFLENDPNAIAVGMTTYEAFRNFDDEDEAKSEYRNSITFYSNEDFPWILQVWGSLIENYNSRITTLEREIETTSGMRQQRFKQLLNEEKYDFYSSVVQDNFTEIKRYIAIIMFISIAILISPIFLRDQLTSVVPLQYSSKKGRELYRTKWLAGFVSTMLLTVGLLTLYLTLYATNNTSSHFDLPLYSLSWNVYWYDMTFWQYIILSVVAIFVSAMLLGVLSMAISTVVRNTIALIGIQIVVLFVMIAGVSTYMIADIISIWHAKWLVPVGYLLLTASSVMVARFVWRRELRRDIV